MDFHLGRKIWEGFKATTLMLEAFHSSYHFITENTFMQIFRH